MFGIQDQVINAKNYAKHVLKNPNISMIAEENVI